MPRWGLDNSAFTGYIVYMTTTQKNIRRMTDTELQAAREAAIARYTKNPTQTNGYRMNNYAVEAARRGWGWGR